VAAKIQQHVQDMVARVEGGRPIRMRDPLFAAVFQNADKIHIEVEKTDKGVKVNETSDNPFVAKLLKAHASVVSLFLKNGWSEMPKDHAVPDEVDKQASAAHRGPGWQSHAGELPTSP
jgi:hypothetical protein